MNTDDFCLDDDNFDGNDDHIDALKERVRAYRDAARSVVANWSCGDLSGAVQDLAAVIESKADLPAGFYADKAMRLGFMQEETADGQRWRLCGGGASYKTARKAIASVE